jgi:hypothetical protein
MIAAYFRWLVGVFLVALGGLLAFAVIAGYLIAQAFGQDTRSEHDAGHMKYHPAYSTWAVPGGAPGSCCNMRRREADGSMTGDCYPTEYRPVLKDGRFDHWQALLDDYDGGGWVDVPNERIIHEKNPDPSGVSGHLCYGHALQMVYCGVPPAGTL